MAGTLYGMSKEICEICWEDILGDILHFGELIMLSGILVWIIDGNQFGCTSWNSLWYFRS